MSDEFWTLVDPRPEALWIGMAACELRDHELRFQEVHAITFLAHAAHLTRTSRPICRDAFRATVYGPRAQSLDRHVRRFHNACVGPVLPSLLDALRGRRPHRPGLERSARVAVHDVVETTRDWSPAQFIELTHQSGSPWDVASDDGWDAIIPNDDIERWGYDPHHSRPPNTLHEDLRAEGFRMALDVVRQDVRDFVAAGCESIHAHAFLASLDLTSYHGARWRPMPSAPRDGTWIEVRASDGSAHLVRFLDGRWRRADGSVYDGSGLHGWRPDTG